MLKRFDTIQNNVRSKKDILKKMNDKTFTNSLKLKILKYLLSIKNENTIRHRWRFKNLYLFSWELIVAIDFDVLTDFVEHSIRCIFFSRVSKRKMYFVSTDKDDDVKLHEIAITSSIICDSSFMIVRMKKIFRKIAVRMKWIKIFCNRIIAVKSWNADRIVNYKSTEEYEMISKIHKNFNKNKRIINIRDNLFQKICCLSTIETKNDHNLKFHLFKFLKLSAFIFFFVN